MPFLEGAGGIVVGVITGDYVAGLVVTTFSLTSYAALATKGAVKITLSAAVLFLTTANVGVVRTVGLGVALGSVESFLIDLIVASPWAKQLGLSYASARGARARATIVNQTNLPPGQNITFQG